MVHLYKSPGCWPAAGSGARCIIRDRPGGSVPAAARWPARSMANLAAPGRWEGFSSAVCCQPPAALKGGLATGDRGLGRECISGTRERCWFPWQRQDVFGIVVLTQGYLSRGGVRGF